MSFKVAVITRTKDRPAFLKRAIRSVSSQSFTDYIHVIVNDGGDVKLLDQAINDFNDEIRSKIKIFHRQVSSGAPDTIFNESIDRVASEYFSVHDDDDTWHPDFLRETVAILESKKSLGAVVVRTDMVMESVSGSKFSKKKQSAWMPDLKVINLYRQCIDNQFTPISTLFRRSAYEKVGKFDDSLPIVGDWEFGVRLLMHYDADIIDPGYPLAFYHHRKRVGNSSDSVSGKEKHRYYTNQVMNTYLRKELANGELGIGYIMSQLKNEQRMLHTLVKRFIPSFVRKK